MTLAGVAVPGSPLARLPWPSVLLVALLSGCATTRPITEPAATTGRPADAGEVVQSSRPSPGDAAVTDALVPPSPATEPAPVSEQPADVWARLRAGFRFPDVCQQKPQTRRWTRVYARDPKAFERELGRVAAELEFVANVLALRRVPADFALLPWVESQFRAVETSGNRPAGVWQFMPATARDFGLAVRPGYDARLDLYAATLAAASLLEHLGASFNGDWRLASMAFNAGEFRVRRAIARRKDPMSPLRVEDLSLSPITHEHLAKLEALGCLIRHPERYGIELPTLADDARLRVVSLPGPIDRDLARAMAGIDDDQFARLNPALRTPLLPAGRHLLLPQSALSRWQSLAGDLPRAAAARDWRPTPTADAGAAVIGKEADHLRGIDPDWLALLNDETGASRGPALLPLGEHAAPLAATDAGSGERYRVRSGDSPWTIARRFGVRLDALLRANALGERSILRPGQWLRIPR
jgi:membrane-bound lytic murein transglycosylase D